MNTVTLQPASKQLYQMQTQNAHPRLSLRRVLYTKFLRYVDKTPTTKLGRHAVRACGALCVILVSIAPQYLLGFSSAMWGSKWLLAACMTVAYLYGWAIVKWVNRLQKGRDREREGNQHTFEGIPIDELATYIIEQKGFQREHAVQNLGISRKKQVKIAKQLEAAEVLRRGENNSRVLHEKITREELVTQLSQNFPLRWNETYEKWEERGGAHSGFFHDMDRKQREEREKIERLTKRRKNVQKKLTEEIEMAHGFTHTIIPPCF